MSVMGIVYLALVLLMPLSALIARRPPLRQTLLMASAWVAIFGIGAVVMGWLA